MADHLDFEFYDKSQDVRITHGHLPHWFQPGVTYFVTFRTEDSVPQDLVRTWYRDRDFWLRRHNIDPRSKGWKAQLRASADLEREYHRRFTSKFMEYLDRGLGECPLRDSQLAGIVAGSLAHFDGERYHLGDYVVMPNHVHVLVCLLGTTEIEKLCKSWKHFTATQINRLLGRDGRFWQEESFDHLVRGPDQFELFQRYIAENPRKANLVEGEYLLRTLRT
jgi:REP element-mobilizing transposase RayT